MPVVDVFPARAVDKSCAARVKPGRNWGRVFAGCLLMRSLDYRKTNYFQRVFEGSGWKLFLIGLRGVRYAAHCFPSDHK